MAKKNTEVQPAGGIPNGYEVGQWCGRTQYRCARCSFDVLDDEDAMLNHIALAHGNIRIQEVPPVATAEASQSTDSAEAGGNLFEVDLKEVTNGKDSIDQSTDSGAVSDTASGGAGS